MEGERRQTVREEECEQKTVKERQKMSIQGLLQITSIKHSLEEQSSTLYIC